MQHHRQSQLECSKCDLGIVLLCITHKYTTCFTGHADVDRDGTKFNMEYGEEEKCGYNYAMIKFPI